MFNAPFASYDYAHNLYADGVMQISARDDNGMLAKGIFDLESFVDAGLDSEELANDLKASVLKVFTEELMKNTLSSSSDDEQNQTYVLQALETFKFFGILGYKLKNMCRQHFAPRAGVVVDNFIQYENCRRLVEDCGLLTREEVAALMETMTKDNPQSPLSLAFNSALEENQQIDLSIESSAFFSSLDHVLVTGKTKFPLFNGSAFRHPGVARKSGSCLCSDYYKKDRWFSDFVESMNHALGVDGHRQMLLSGCPNGSSMLASLLTTKDQLFETHYEEIAASINSGLCLSLLHLRNCPIAFTGKLKFTDSTPAPKAK